MERKRKRVALVGWRKGSNLIVRLIQASERDGKALEGATEVAETQLHFVWVDGRPDHAGVQIPDDHVDWMLQEEDATKLEKRFFLINRYCYARYKCLMIFLNVDYLTDEFYTISILKYVCLSQLAYRRSQFLLDRLGRYLKLFVSTDSISSHEFASQFGL